MKAVVYSELTGAALAGALFSTLDSGKVLPNVKDLGLWTAAGLVAADILFEEHLHPIGQEAMNGVGSASIGYLANELMSKYVFKKSNSSNASSPASTTMIPTYTAPTLTSASSSAGTNASTTAVNYTSGGGGTLSVASGVPSLTA